MVTYYLKLFYSRHAATLLYYIVVLFYLVICVSPFFMRTVMHIRFTKPLAFSLDEILTLRVSSTLYIHYVKDLANLSGRWTRTTNLHHLSSYKGGALPVKLFPVISQSTPSFSFNSWKSLSNSSTINFISFSMSHISLKNLIHPIVQHIVILNTQIQANCQNNRCYHILKF